MAKFNLRGARVNAGFTQKAVLARLKISNKTLSNWENGISYPNAKQISELCALYGRTYDEIDFLPDNPLKAETAKGAE